MRGVEIRGFNIAAMERLPEGLQRAIQSALQIGRQARFMLIIEHLAVVSEDTVEDLLCLEGTQHRFQGVINCQQMRYRAARCQRQYHFICQRAFGKQVE